MSDSDLTIIHGDTTDVLETIAPRSVQCVVTSPPYYGLRDYGIPPTAWPEISYQPMPGLTPVIIPAQSACLGLESTPEAYTAHLVYVFRLIHDALADDGVAWLNLGDSYAASRSYQVPPTKHKNLDFGTSNATKVPTGLKAKDMIGIPWRVAFALQADGWYLRSDVIWHKPNAMPESVKDRPTKDHEYVFLLAKSERYFYNVDAIREPNKTASNIRTKASEKHAENRIDRPIGPGEREWNNLLGRNRRTVWAINTKAMPDAHYAPMPDALAEPCILAGSRPGDLILDPFGGTATTARVALIHGRRAISIDLNPAYIDIHDDRTAYVQRKLV